MRLFSKKLHERLFQITLSNLTAFYVDWTHENRTLLPIRLLSLCWTSGLVEMVDYRVGSLNGLVLCGK